MKISATIIAQNEEHNIAAAIDSVKWADEIVVVDSGSTDLTRETAESLGAKVVVRAWEGFAAQKQFAVDEAANDWIFSLDADERASPELKDEILALAADGGRADGYTIPRLSFYMSRPIRHGGWYPDRQLRLFDRRKGRWSPRRIHESIEMAPGSVTGSLWSDLYHFSVEGPAHHHRMIGERYAPLAAEQMLSEGRSTSAIRMAAAGPAAFIRSYILKLGFLDGMPGFAIASFAAHHSFLKHLLLLEMQKQADLKNNGRS